MFIFKKNYNDMGQTRSGEFTSAQIGRMGVIAGLQDGDFQLPDGHCFNIKNDTDSAVTLDIMPAGMDGYVTTRIDPGWNPEIVRAVRQSSLTGLDLKWGY